MRRLPVHLRRFFAALLCIAMMSSPAASFGAPASASAAQPQSHDAMNHTAQPGKPPCDMPCGGCADDSGTAACFLACSALTASLPSFAPLHRPAALFQAANRGPSGPFTGRAREPDTPPPKPVLA